MATLYYSKGKRAIQFAPARKGRRRTIHLGAVSLKTARRIHEHVEHLISSRASHQPVPQQTAEWLGEIGDDLHSKLAKHGLVEPREVRRAVALGAYLDNLIASRTDLKPATIANLKQARNSLVAHFTEARDLRTITKGEAGDWHRGLKATHAKATVAMHVKKARQMFRDAVDRKIIGENPITGIKAGKMSNPDRMEYVSVETVLKVIKACPDAEWRFIFAAARFAGLRIPSEARALRWTDIRWDDNRMLVRAPKTEHLEGRAVREVPIFTALYPYLRELLELSEDGATHVIAQHRGDNPRTMAEKIIERAGVPQWEKLFQNLRSSCETDLACEFPIHVVCAWIGNTEEVARRHYLQVTDAHFERAAFRAAPNDGQHRTSADPSMQKAPETEAFAQSGYPQGESHSRPNSARITQDVHNALQSALHSFEKRLPDLRRADIDRLGAAVAAARSPATPSDPSPGEGKAGAA